MFIRYGRKSSWKISGFYFILFFTVLQYQSHSLRKWNQFMCKTTACKPCLFLCCFNNLKRFICIRNRFLFLCLIVSFFWWLFWHYTTTCMLPFQLKHMWKICENIFKENLFDVIGMRISAWVDFSFQVFFAKTNSDFLGATIK